MRVVPFSSLSGRRCASALAAASSVFALSATAAAQSAPAGTMKQDAASSGKTEVASSGFATVAKNEHLTDTTEAKVQAGAVLATGNARSLAVTSLGSFLARRGMNELSLAGAANYGRSSSKAGEPVETTMENYQGKLRYDRFLSERFAVFTALSARRDRFQGLDLRLNLDPGLAYYFVQEPKQQLWAEVGYDLQFDIRRKGVIAAAAAEGNALEKTDTRHSGRLFAGYKSALNEAVSFNTGVEYLQGLADTEFWRLNWDLGFTAAIATRFSLATTFSLRYDNHPLVGVEKTDTLTAVNLVYTLL